MLNVQHVTYSSEEQCRRAPTPLCGLRPTALNKLRAQKVTLWLFYQSQLPETVCNHFQARNQMAPLPILGSTWQNHPSAGSNRAGALQSWEAVLTAGKNLCAGWRAQGTLEGHLQERTEDRPTVNWYILPPETTTKAHMNMKQQFSYKTMDIRQWRIVINKNIVKFELSIKRI